MRIEAPPEKVRADTGNPAALKHLEIGLDHHHSDGRHRAQLNHRVAQVMAARYWLYAAQFGFADDGLECLRLDGIVDEVSVLLSDWQGRQRPTGRVEESPTFVNAAIAWRDERARRTRR